MRAGGAQVLEGEGVPLPTIERYGRWSISSSVVDVYLTNAPPDALLAMGGYGYCTGPAMQTAFFAPRFKAVLPEELLLPLINHLMPNLEALRECAKGIKGSDPARMSAINFPEVLTYLMGVLVQDSLELADRAPANPVVQWLQKRDEWHTLRERYLMCREELARCKPPTTMEAISYQSRQNAQLSRQNAQLSQQLSQLLNTLGQQVQAVGPDGPQQLAQMGGPQQLAPSAAGAAGAGGAQMGGPQQLAPFAAAQQVQVGWPGGPPFMQPQQLAPFAAALQAQMGGPQQLAPFAAAQQVQVGGPQQLAPFTAAQQVQAQMGGPQQLAPFAAAQQVQVGGPQQLAPFTAAQQVQVGWPGGPPFMQPQQLAPFAAAQHAQVGGPQQLTPSAAAQHAQVGGPQQLTPSAAAQQVQVGGPQQLAPFTAAQQAQVGGPQQLTPSAAAQHAQVGGPQQLAPFTAAQQVQVGGPQQLTPSRGGAAGAVACGVAAGGAALELQMLSPESRHRRADEVVAATMEGRAAPPLGSGRATGGDATGGAATGGAASGSAAACGAAVLAVASKQTKKKEPAAVVQAGASAAVLWKWRSDAVELKFLMDGALPYRKNELTTLLELYDAYYRGCPTDCGGRMPPWIDLFNLYGPKDDRNALANMEAGSWYPGGKVAKQLTQRMWEFRSLHRWCIVVTGELRGRGLKEGGGILGGQGKADAEALLGDVVQHIVEEPALLKEIVAVSPSQPTGGSACTMCSPPTWARPSAATGNTAGGAAGSGAAAGGVGEAFAATGNTAGGTAGGGAAAGGVGEPVARAKNVLYLWLQAKAAEPGPDMTLSERMQGWFTMTYAERTAWKARYKMIRC
ncbi:hypothetical protein HYH02_001002 [Chlamydomonas schloesseri]|uniref:Uncharacterized protein n=1 Tax=Chlamydomonas schloesseri TaxID=2026947 RepID=A0A835WUH6_9CHLO|nr:hypothetical protein HYH02_001002 [Chlamydomonas schloesseri]|eukprot:KAG2453955.1 hypothetical protein HYH02_001002 [Chlamydomonas schloesseri]